MRQKELNQGAKKIEKRLTTRPSSSPVYTNPANGATHVIGASTFAPTSLFKLT